MLTLSKASADRYFTKLYDTSELSPHNAVSNHETISFGTKPNQAQPTVYELHQDKGSILDEQLEHQQEALTQKREEERLK